MINIQRGTTKMARLSYTSVIKNLRQIKNELEEINNIQQYVLHINIFLALWLKYHITNMILIEM